MNQCIIIYFPDLHEGFSETIDQSGKDKISSNTTSHIPLTSTPKKEPKFSKVFIKILQYLDVSNYYYYFFFF